MALLQAIEMLFGRRAMLHCGNASWRPEIAGMACSKGAKVDQAKAGAWVIGYVDIIARYHMSCCFSLKLVPLTPLTALCALLITYCNISGQPSDSPHFCHDQFVRERAPCAEQLGAPAGSADLEL